MATPTSDVDIKGVYIAPTLNLLSLHPPAETVDRTNPDFCYHELGKFIHLALACNPTILELLYMDDYLTLTRTGKEMVEGRSNFLSERVRKTYGGYAMSQIKRLQDRGGESFSSNLAKRRAKHARHCFRLLQQGKELLETGTLTVKVADPDELFRIGELPTDELVKEFEKANAEFMEVPSVLPKQPNEAVIDHFLRTVRRSWA